MKEAIQFQPIRLAFAPVLLSAIVECSDCGQHTSTHGAITHGWRTVERDVGSQVYVTDYVCADCCEARIHDYNQMVADDI